MASIQTERGLELIKIFNYNLLVILACDSG